MGCLDFTFSVDKLPEQYSGRVFPVLQDQAESIAFWVGYGSAAILGMWKKVHPNILEGLNLSQSVQ